MTRLLAQAIEKAEQLPDDLQDAVASDILEIIDGDLRWEKLLADPRTPALLEKMGAEAIASMTASERRRFYGEDDLGKKP